MMIGKTGLTGNKIGEATAPGMAHFAGSGPEGKTCGDCAHKGYIRERHNGKHYRHGGCAKFKVLTGSHGPAIEANLKACKYFEQSKVP
jgi:hypothetical protein